MAEVVSFRKSLSDAMANAAAEAKADREGLESRLLDEEGAFDGVWVKENDILIPPYDPEKLYVVVENSSILPQCIDAMKLNTAGFGHDFSYTGDIEMETSEEVKKEKKYLIDFFKKVNEIESFTTVHKLVVQDREATGNGYIEVIRTLKGEIGVMYHADSRYIRLQKKQKDPVDIEVKLTRGGKEITVKVKKRFRRFVMVTNTTKRSYRWFKEYGDPRKMNADNGAYEGEPKYKAGNDATEILHFKIGSGTYGVPRWSGNIPNAMGLHSADYVNYDLFENQVVPPLAIMVSGGKLTQETIKDVESILIRKRGVENFNKVLVLEAQGEGDINQNTNIKIELKELSQARKEDAMFTTYVDRGEHRIRGSFRLPPLYLGRADCFDSETETLTDQGWKYCTEIDGSERIATINPANHMLEFKTPTDFVMYDYKGPMCHFLSSVVDVKVKPDHDMWVKLSKNGEWHKEDASKVFEGKSEYSSCYFKTAPSLLENEDVEKYRVDRIHRRSEEVEFRTIDADLLIKLTACYVADGSMSSTSQAYNISLSANKERKLLLFDEVSSGIDLYPGVRVSYCAKSDGMGKFTISDRGIFEWLSSNCGVETHSKKLPDSFLRLSRRQSLILLECLANTDGSLGRRNDLTAFRYSTTSKVLADQVQLLGFRCGYRAVLNVYEDCRESRGPVYYVNFKESEEVMVGAKQLEYVDYNGIVYCFEVPNHLFVTRRNGRITIQGNTYSKSTADSSKMVAEEQVFVPERQGDDEVINNTIMAELGVKYHAYKSKGPRLITGEDIITGFKEFGKLGVFSINEGVRIANRTLGLDITTYDKPWAEFPVAIVLEMAKLGMLSNIDEITDATSTVSNVLNGITDPNQAAKAYHAFRILHKQLKEFTDKRMEEEEDEDGRLWTPVERIDVETGEKMPL